MYFETASDAQKKTYALFADVSGNGLYGTNELISSTDIQRGFYISKLCAPAGSDSLSCTQISRLDILFKRPEPDAYISSDISSCVQSSSYCKDSARIVVVSPRGDSTSIIVEASGQIYVKKN